MRLNKAKEAGLAYLLVLIILAIGALTVVPALRLSFTSLRSTEILSRHDKGFYAAESAQNFVQWDLYYGDLMQELGFLEGQNSANFTMDICGTPVDVSVIMRATELEGGVTLATDDTILATKTVDTGLTPSDFATDKNYDGPFTYTITVSQESSNNTNGLDRIYDIFSADFKAGSGYVAGSSEISGDGTNWTTIDDPLEEQFGGNQRLRWPATGDFSSPFRDFVPGQEKYLRFQWEKAFNQNNMTICNFVMLKVGNVMTVSTAIAPITVGPTYPGATACDSGGVFDVETTSDPVVIPPNQSTNVTYTVIVTNLQGSAEGVYTIISYLPPGFTYIGPTTTNMTNPVDWGPITDTVIQNGVERQKLTWDDTQLTPSGYNLGAGDNITMVYIVNADQDISGSYYNEVLVYPKNPPEPAAFEIDDPPLVGIYGVAYSWRTGVIIVPAYDANTLAEGANITTNMSVEPNTVSVISWTAD